MREIKIKAWDTINNMMIPWDVLKMISTNAIGETRTETMQVISDDSYITVTDLAGNISEIVSSNPKIETKLKSKTYVRYNRGHNIWTDDNLIKLQFTGLLDKNGKEIYEGDIIKEENEKLMIISWNEKLASFVLNREGWAFAHWFGESCSPEDVAIVGNKFENQELLNK